MVASRKTRVLAKSEKNAEVITALDWLITNAHVLHSKAAFLERVIRKDLTITLSLDTRLSIYDGVGLLNDNEFREHTALMTGVFSEGLALSSTCPEGNRYEVHHLTFGTAVSSDTFARLITIGRMEGRNNPIGLYIRDGESGNGTIFISQALSIGRCIVGFYRCSRSHFVRSLVKQCSAQGLPHIERSYGSLFTRLSILEKQKAIPVVGDLAYETTSSTVIDMSDQKMQLLGQFTEHNSVVSIAERDGEYIVMLESVNRNPDFDALAHKAFTELIRYQKYCEEFIRLFSLDMIVENV